MRYVFPVLAILFAACSPNGAQADPQIAPSIKEITAMPTLALSGWSVDKSKSHMKFTAEQNGEEFTGLFEDYTPVIKFDPNDLSNAKVSVDIDIGTAETGDIDRDEALPGKDWFNLKAFPKAKFETTSFSHMGGDKYEAKAVLTLRGMSKNVTFPFSLKIQDGVADMVGQLIINRRDYNIGNGMWKSQDWVGHAVTVDVRLRATNLHPKN